ncbi:hypothetical protein AFK63_06310 [Cronobacter muytjensii ATCC 51329]|uniref:Uncharacterized protein n=1 Tax=Cronobacter muytjensii TaxID=413501 RepID=A0A2T7AKR3_9ENTR|nr:hypothetical protein AFK63_06310 [Cronobacter muytjensii ATCC 51329]PUX09200.1 hypothetical protein AUN14_19065 [Cronobacter muytjensii]
MPTIILFSLFRLCCCLRQKLTLRGIFLEPAPKDKTATRFGSPLASGIKKAPAKDRGLVRASIILGDMMRGKN